MEVRTAEEIPALRTDQLTMLFPRVAEQLGQTCKAGKHAFGAGLVAEAARGVWLGLTRVTPGKTATTTSSSCERATVVRCRWAHPGRTATTASSSRERFPESAPLDSARVPPESCKLWGTGVQRGLRLGQNRSCLLFGRLHHAGGPLALLHQVLPAREQFLPGNLAGIDVGQDRFLGHVVLVHDARHALQHAPRRCTSR